MIIGSLIVAGWYVSGHLGFGENPETLEESYFGTNSRTLESMSFGGPAAYSLELLLMWTDKSHRAILAPHATISLFRSRAGQVPCIR